MIKIQGIGRGITQTNPYEDDSEFMDVKLMGTDQVVKALVGNPLNANRASERVFIDTGTEVIILNDEMDNFYVISSTGHGGGKVESTTTELFEVNTNKLKFTNATAELISLLSDFMATVSSLKAVDTGKHGSVAGNWSHDKVGDINALKSKLDSFKV